MDHKLTCLLHDRSGKWPWLDKLAIFCARDLPFVFVLFPVIMLSRQVYEQTSSGRFVWFFVFVGFGLVIIVSQVAAYGMQRLIRRKRPFQSEHLHPIYKARIPSPSFPSGHATLVAVVLWLAWSTPPISWIFWSTLGMGILVLLARIYGGLHYVSDILAGLLFGSTMFWLFVYLLFLFDSL